jgi:hypothetical protein
VTSHRRTVESETARLVATRARIEEEAATVEGYWDELTLSLRMEILDLAGVEEEGGREGGREEEVVWALESEQGMMPTRRRVLLTPQIVKVRREGGREGGREGWV